MKTATCFSSACIAVYIVFICIGPQKYINSVDVPAYSVNFGVFCIYFCVVGVAETD